MFAEEEAHLLLCLLSQDELCTQTGWFKSCEEERRVADDIAKKLLEAHPALKQFHSRWS
jgi:hypothetical protein